ncbi:hypothetical protein ABN154_28800, partial [Klebsiella michiganensis]|uniref:hypothetical protein n=1 Tax=Klebsiella michiganensis TaxID=1134687 RepID=UPI0032D9CA79
KTDGKSASAMKVTLLIDVLITEERVITGAQTNYLVIYCPLLGFNSYQSRRFATTVNRRWSLSIKVAPTPQRWPCSTPVNLMRKR